MRHHQINRKFGRAADSRRAFLRSLAEGLIKRDKIKTTEARAKALRRFIEPLVTKAKLKTIASRRLLISKLGTPARTRRLIEVVAPRYEKRAGGYTRIVKLGRRPSDGSSLALIEFV